MPAIPPRMPVTRVLHRAGNVRELLHLALHPTVDAIEADIWVSRGQFFAHHERPVGPLLLSQRGLHRPGDRVPLEAILDEVEGHAGVVIDLRSWFGDPSADLARLLRDRPGGYAHVQVSCESWGIADRLYAWLPDLRVAYSIRSEAQLRGYLDTHPTTEDGAPPGIAVTVRDSLLTTPGTVDSLRARAGIVGAWTIDDVERALELRAWGVDQIVSNHLVVLNAI